MPVRLAVTEGTVADCSQALPLIEGIEAECLLADKAYDTNEIIDTVRGLGIDPVIPPKSNRPKATVGKSGTMTGLCTSCGTWWRTDSWNSSSGAEWRPVMPRERRRTWPSANSGQ